MSDRQALVSRVNVVIRGLEAVNVGSRKIPESALATLREAATALEEAQGVPREPTDAMLAAVAAWGVSPAHPHLGLSRNLAWAIWQAMWGAAPAAPTRDEQDARRYRWLRDNGAQQSVLKEPILARVLASGTLIEWDKGGDAADASLDAALAEQKR